MGGIRQPYNYSSRYPDPGAFIQCVDGRDPMIHELWGHENDSICRKVQPTACIEIPAGTVGEFITEYLSENRLQNQIIGELSTKGIVQLILLS